MLNVMYSAHCGHYHYATGTSLPVWSNTDHFANCRILSQMKSNPEVSHCADDGSVMQQQQHLLDNT